MSDKLIQTDKIPHDVVDSDQTASQNEPEVTPEHRHRSRGWLFVIGSVILLMIILALVLFLRGTLTPKAVEPRTVSWAEIVITDLYREKSFDGILGSIEDDPIITRRGGTITWIASPGTVINQGEMLFTIDSQPVVLLYGALPAYRDITIGEDVVVLSSQFSGVLTWIAEPGTVIEQGDVIFRVDDRPVILLYGSQPAYRNIEMMGSNPADLAAMAEARSTLSQSKADLTALTSQPDQQMLEAAKQNLASAQIALENLLDPAKANEISVSIAEHQLEQAKNALWGSQIQRDSVCGQVGGGGSQADCDAANAGVQQNEEAVRIAELNLESATSSPGAGEIAAARAEVAQAQAAVDTLQQETDPDSGAAAEERVLQAQAVLDILLSESSLQGTGYDVGQLENSLVTLGYDPSDEVTVDNEFDLSTCLMVKAWQKDIGMQVDGIVNFGEVIFLPGPIQILDYLIPLGNQAAGGVVSVASGKPTTGTDVKQLEEALISLGFGSSDTLQADGVYTLETYKAVLAFQAATGLNRDGIIDLGEVIFLPDPVRIIHPLENKGSNIGAGASVLGVSLSEKIVRVSLPANEQGLLALGDVVTVEMPDSSLVPATVIFVSQTAVPSEDGGATFEIYIKLDNPSVAENLDEAPVDVIVISDSADDVMAVPVSALVALLEGGYAVEIDAGDGSTQYVAVDLGFFGSNNMVQISSPTLRAGDRVVVP